MQRFHAGRLLVATPSLSADEFSRSVILLLHHDDTGANGVILNQPMPATVESVLPGWGSLCSAPPTLFHGGPVETDSAIGLVTVPGEVEEPLGIRILFGRTGVVDLDAPQPVVAAHLAGMRVFAGYAGWAPGQLEGELVRGDWYVTDAEARDAFAADPTDLWTQVLRRQRDSRAFAAFYPPDPEWN